MSQLNSNWILRVISIVPARPDSKDTSWSTIPAIGGENLELWSSILKITGFVYTWHYGRKALHQCVPRHLQLEILSVLIDRSIYVPLCWAQGLRFRTYLSSWPRTQFVQKRPFSDILVLTEVMNFRVFSGEFWESSGSPALYTSGFGKCNSRKLVEYEGKRGHHYHFLPGALYPRHFAFPGVWCFCWILSADLCKSSPSV